MLTYDFRFSFREIGGRSGAPPVSAFAPPQFPPSRRAALQSPDLGRLRAAFAPPGASPAVAAAPGARAELGRHERGNWRGPPISPRSRGLSNGNRKLTY